ncbi:hypothetical protein ACFU3E_30990 [Streptomyces sp. NPDC057424]|uniref:hypothetical protein n=1 Tax=Streptomyces sp. NPDC057424 TaxID=3346127 RepID=UPI0036B771FF
MTRGPVRPRPGRAGAGAAPAAAVRAGASRGLPAASAAVNPLRGLLIIAVMFVVTH